MSSGTKNGEYRIGSLSESLFIPLVVKADETNRIKGVLKDQKAVEIVNSLGLDRSNYDGGNITSHGILTRTVVLDRIVDDYIKDNPGSIILNLGAGLDTRVERFKDRNLLWYDLDLPEVIELRKKYFEESEKDTFIAASVLDENWVSQINREPEQKVLIIAEGLLMYFKEDDIRDIFTIIKSNFSGAEMCFDVVHSFFVGKGVNAKFNWGIEKVEDVLDLAPGIELIKNYSTGDFLKKRQGFLLKTMNIMNSTRNRSRILHIKIN